ncbi:hypothetical protein N7495_008781 [Penicillium taxi]|uniref:uncharacterized protein n=1 Tax=Penicillium taxi TaxID=168475 RepID=UPI0025457A6E|nr:uncharacterized protein N7495_008781 [Penicillium taxi]KAJ5888740.1 hypothetical protein N7495_008781 [Penicillium taxi]
MASESERLPCLDGSSDRTKATQDAEVASDTLTRSSSDGDMTEIPRPSVKSPQPMSQMPKLIHNLQISSIPASSSASAVSSRDSSPLRNSSRTNNTSLTDRVQSHSHSRRSSKDRLGHARSLSNGHLSTIPIRSSTPPAQLAGAQPSTPDRPANVLSPENPNMPSRAENRRAEPESTLPNTSQKRSFPQYDEYGKTERSSPRTVARGASGQGLSLETVQEMASDPSTSSETILLPATPVTPDDSRLHTIDEDPTPRASRHNTESGSDSGGNRSSEMREESRSRATSSSTRPPGIMPQRSSTSLSAGARGKPADVSVRNMTVETETVSSIPQVSLGVGAGERGTTGRAEPGTLRMKRSTETIRPRKEKKKNRRQNNLTGPASSKADIFEAKVASAVDEADVSDSDETFVYESNPPDPFPPRQSRYHSRTPSATSMASQVDQLAGLSNLGGRSRGGLRDGVHSVTGKRSMKFTNNTYTSSLDGEAAEADGNRNGSRGDGSGTITPRHHHIGRHGRSIYPSLFDNDSPFPSSQTQQPLKSPRHFIGSGYRTSRNSNTRSSPNYRSVSGSKKAGEVYDFDAEGADDERTPLVGNPRVPRSRHGRRPNSASLRQMEYMAQRERGCLSRFGSCFMLILLVLMVTGFVTSFFIAATKTLVDVEVVAIENVLASEQEIMLDLKVHAVNPNIFPVTIDDTDINIFAKSRYVGSDKFWREHHDVELMETPPRVQDSRRKWKLAQFVRCLGNADCIEAENKKPNQKSNGGVDHGTDPISDPEGDSQTMLLGRVLAFDSPLSFEASPWSHRLSTSKGQIQLPHPGNTTDQHGIERWEQVLQHPFELIVRGVIKYQLPFNSRYLSAPISSSIKVVPNDDDDDSDTAPPSNETAHVSFTTSTSIPFTVDSETADSDTPPNGNI